MTVTPERQKNIDFSDSYTTSQQVIVVRNNDAVSGGTSLSEKFKTDFLTCLLYPSHNSGNFIKRLRVLVCIT